MGFEKIFDIVDKILGHFTPAERIKRYKNELDKLKQERSEILVKKAEIKFSNRLLWIARRIKYLERMLENEATA